MVQIEFGDDVEQKKHHDDKSKNKEKDDDESVLSRKENAFLSWLSSRLNKSEGYSNECWKFTWDHWGSG